MYKLNNKSNSYKASVSGEKQCMDRYLNEEVALTALGIILGKYGIVLDILNIVGQGFDYIYSPAEVSNNYSGYERDILVSNVNEDYKCSLMALPNNINSLIANQVYDYSYKIGIDIPFESVSTTNVNERKVYYKSAFNVQLFDVNGDIISNGEHSYEYDGSPYLETNKYGKTIGLPYKANILASDEEDNNMFRVKESGTVIIETAVNTYVSVADIYGRVMASSKNPYGKSQYVITYLEKDKYYYVITGYNMPNTGEYNISFKTNISYLTDNSTTYIRNSNDSVSLIYKYRPNNVPIGIDVFTNSYQDTNIAIYTEKGQFLNGNDDYYYDPDSDFSDYNASCQIGITTNIDYYIVINSYKVNNLDDEIVIKVVTV